MFGIAISTATVSSMASATFRIRCAIRQRHFDLSPAGRVLERRRTVWRPLSSASTLMRGMSRARLVVRPLRSVVQMPGTNNSLILFRSALSDNLQAHAGLHFRFPRVAVIPPSVMESRICHAVIVNTNLRLYSWVSRMISCSILFKGKFSTRVPKNKHLVELTICEV